MTVKELRDRLDELVAAGQGDLEVGFELKDKLGFPRQMFQVRTVALEGRHVALSDH